VFPLRLLIPQQQQQEEEVQPLTHLILRWVEFVPEERATQNDFFFPDDTEQMLSLLLKDMSENISPLT
ncbi:hypothetical protein KUCAC02_000530, partial [Chaenocephalus aceratus]